MTCRYGLLQWRIMARQGGIYDQKVRGNELRDLRLARGLTIEAAAREVGVGTRTWARWEAEGVSELGMYKLREVKWL